MQGFNREKARDYILSRLDKRGFAELSGDAAALTEQAIDADLGYMRQAGVLTEDGGMGDAFYDDDDAYEYILDAMSRLRKTPDRQMDSLCDFIEQYMELIERYMTENDLLSWQ